MFRQYYTNQTKRNQRIISAIVILIVAGIGTYLIVGSHASTPYVSTTADSGSLANGAVKQSCSGSSNGNCVVFNGASSVSLGNQPSPPALFDSTDGSTPYLTSQIPLSPKLDPNSSALVGTLSSQVLGVNTGPDWIIPLYNTNNSDPSYSPVFSEDWGCTEGSTNVIHIPNYAARETPGPNPSYWDGWVGTVNTDTNMVSGIWKADKSTGNWNGACGGSFPLHGNGFRAGEAHPTYGVGTGSGSQIGAGLILYSELISGSINHALYMTSQITCGTYRAPASKSDGNHTGTCWQMGTRVQLNPSINCDTLGGSAVERMVCHALENYGGYVMDSGGGGPLTGIATIGDDMTDPARSPWQKPGAPVRGSANCAPISATCGVLAHFGVVNGSSTFPHIPTSQFRALNSWNGT